MSSSSSSSSPRTRRRNQSNLRKTMKRAVSNWKRGKEEYNRRTY